MRMFFSLPLPLLASLHPQAIHVKADRKPCTETVRGRGRGSREVATIQGTPQEVPLPTRLHLQVWWDNWGTERWLLQDGCNNIYVLWKKR